MALVLGRSKAKVFSKIQKHKNMLIQIDNTITDLFETQKLNTIPSNCPSFNNLSKQAICNSKIFGNYLSYCEEYSHFLLNSFEEDMYFELAAEAVKSDEIKENLNVKKLSDMNKNIKELL